MPNVRTNAAPTDQYRAAIDTYRTTLKWVLSSFAAVAVALIVGVQLTSLGALHGQRLVLAFIAAGVAFAGVFGIIVLAVRALAPVGGTRAEFAGGRNFKPLRDYLARDRSPLRRMANTAEELAGALEDARTAEIEAKAEHDKNTADPVLRQAFDNARRDRETLAPVVDTVTRFGIYLRVQELFGQAMWAVRIGVPLAAAGALAYAYLANSLIRLRRRRPRPQSTVRPTTSSSTRWPTTTPPSLPGSMSCGPLRAPTLERRPAGSTRTPISLPSSTGWVRDSLVVRVLGAGSLASRAAAGVCRCLRAVLSVLTRRRLTQGTVSRQFNTCCAA
jgi:hypothetical protein